MMDCDLGNFNLLLGLEVPEVQNVIRSLPAFQPRVMDFGGERYVALLGVAFSSDLLLGFIDQGGFEYIYEAVEVQGVVSRIYVGPQNWTVLS